MSSPATSPPPLPTPPIGPATSPPPSSPPPPPDPTPPPSSAPETPPLSPPPSPAPPPLLLTSPPPATPPLSPPLPTLSPPPTESPTSQPLPETSPPPSSSSPPPSSSPPLLPPPNTTPPPLPTSSPPPSPAAIPPTPTPPVVLTPPPEASAPPQPPPVVVVTPSPPISPHSPPPPPSKTSTETKASSPPPPPASLRPVPDPLIPSPATVASPPPPPEGTKHGGGIPASSGQPPPPSSSSRNIPSPNSSDGDGGGGARSSRVSSGLMVGLFAGVVVLALLLVVSVLVVLCRKRRRGRGFEGGGESAGYGGLNYMRFEERNLQPGQSKSTRPYLVSATSQNFVRSSEGSPPQMAVREPNCSAAIVPSFGTFSYEELVAATDGFSESNLLGQGGFGHVYKGALGNGKQVAVKQLRIGGKQGEREFQAEVEIISQVHHRNLVSLVGYCVAGADRMLVYEFVPNKTMEFHLHGEQPVMEWGTRMKIALGSAKGLAYLHEECNPTIIHRDIKAANILLDFNFEAKVSDFGLAKIFSSQDTPITHITTRVVGTFGYLAPEYASSGKVTDKSDVYSYGVVLLELITGRPPICHPPISAAESTADGSLVNWARPLLAQAIENGTLDGLVDPRLQNHYNLDEMHSMVHCAAACVRLSAWRRPRMSQVVRALEGDLSLLDLSSDGIRPNLGPSRFPYETSDSETYQHSEGMKLLRRALANDGYGADGSRYSGTTSEYGLYPSASSIDSQHARS